jgi:hypothetical protein
LAGELALQLPAGAMDSLLTVVLAMRSNAHRGDALAAMAPRLSGASWPRVLAVVRETRGEMIRMEAIAGVMPYAPSTLLPRMLELVGAFRNQGYRAELLRYLPAELSHDLSAAVGGIARGIDDPMFRSRALREVAWRTEGKLADELLDSALDAALGARSEEDRSQAVLELAPLLSGDRFARALGGVEEISRGVLRGRTLAELRSSRPLLPSDEVLRNLLDSACTLDPSADPTLEHGIPLPAVSRGPPREGLEFVSDIEWEFDRVLAVSRMAPSLAAPQFNQALRLVEQIRNPCYRAKGIKGLAPYLPEALLRDAWLKIHGIRDAACYAEAQEALISRICALPKPQLSMLWSETLHAYSGRHRAELLRLIRTSLSIISTLGGEEAIQMGAAAIKDVGGWWR